MTTTELLNRVLSGEITPAQAAEVLKVPEGRVLEWLRAHRENGPASESADAKTPAHRTSTRMRYVLDLYRERYQGASVTAFRRALASEHQIVVAYPILRRELLGAGLLPERRIALWRPGAAAARELDQASTGETAPAGDSDPRRKRNDG